MTRNLPSIDAAATLPVTCHENASGRLTVLQGGVDVAFDISRVFHVVGTDTETPRGKHAHLECKQALFCISGGCQVTLDDGANRKTMLLAAGGDGLYIPPGLWAEQRYMEQGTVLAVLCDQPYDEADYIRDYEDFLGYRQNQK
ncbi:MAG: sugar 3,4-ketoisomerase [Alphaproteobacteria bacterium]